MLQIYSGRYTRRPAGVRSVAAVAILEGTGKIGFVLLKPVLIDYNAEAGGPGSPTFVPGPE
jgi:hypothetical protein